MKKTISLLTLMLLAYVGLTAQNTVSFGSLSPVPSQPVQVNINYNDSSNNFTNTVYTNAQGYFADSLNNVFMGSVTATFINCNGNTIYSYGAPSQQINYDFGTLTYCPPIIADSTSVSGNFINTNGLNFNVYISLDGGISYQTLYVDSSGNFGQMFGATNDSMMSGYYINCNNDTIDLSTINQTPGQTVATFVFDSLDYCPPSTPSTLVNITGQFDPAIPNVQFLIQYQDNGSVVSHSGASDAQGAFSLDSISVSSLPTYMTIKYFDCNGTVIVDTAYAPVSLPVPAQYNFGVLNQCTQPVTDTTIIYGSFINTNGLNFNVYISLDNGVSYQTMVVNSLGNFEGLFGAPVNDSITFGYFVNCHNDTINISAVNQTPGQNQATFAFDSLDYCPPIPASCQANYSVDQNVVIDSFGTIISAGNVLIINNSVGQNLTYTWDFGDGTSAYTGLNFVHTYAGQGPYVLCLTVQHPATPNIPACSSSYCDTLMVNASGVITGKTNLGFTIQTGNASDTTNSVSGINSLEDVASLSLYPNPAENFVKLAIDAEEAAEGIVSIYNITGKQMQQEDISIKTGKSTYNITLKDLNKGLYLVQLKTDKGFITKKLFVK